DSGPPEASARWPLVGNASTPVKTMRVLPAPLKAISTVALCGWVFTSPGWAQPPGPTPGTLKWRVPLIGVLSAGPTLGTNGLVYAVGRPGETLLFAWEASTGNLRWATNLGEFASDHPGSLVIGPEEHVYIRKTSGYRPSTARRAPNYGVPRRTARSPSGAMGPCTSPETL